MAKPHAFPEMADWPELDLNEKNELGLEERNLMRLVMQWKEPVPRLPYVTQKIKMANGVFVEKYIIPYEDKQKVLEELYPFVKVPSLDKEFIDIHTNKKFKVRDYIVTREGDGNWLATPYYAEAGGTVLDWTDEDEGGNDKSRVVFVNVQSVKPRGGNENE